jgi:pimeloyl-ACP methyl ester carboxylesterase
MSVAVVYVHGLWLRGHEGFLLKRRLAKSLGAETSSFTYRSVGATLEDNAIALRRHLAKCRAASLHLVAHSLGGLVVLKMFELEAAASAGGAVAAGAVVMADALSKADAVAAGGAPDGSGAVAGDDPVAAGGVAPLPPGRIVLLGSPVLGSLSARRLARLPLGRSLLGLGGAELLSAMPERRWSGVRELGVIAGDAPYGLGRLLGPMGGVRNDGTVLLDETRLVNASDRLEIRMSHSGMPYSAAVARQTAEFLRSGRFVR